MYWFRLRLQYLGATADSEFERTENPKIRVYRNSTEKKVLRESYAII